MNLATFIDECKLPKDWEPVVRMEALTGCSACERRLIQDDRLIPGVAAIRFYKERELSGVLVLCKECAPQ